MRMSILRGPSQCRKLLGAKAALLYKWIRNQNASFNRVNFTVNRKNCEKSISKLTVLKSCSKQHTALQSTVLHTPPPFPSSSPSPPGPAPLRPTQEPALGLLTVLLYVSMLFLLLSEQRIHLSQPLSLKHSHNS